MEDKAHQRYPEIPSLPAIPWQVTAALCDSWTGTNLQGFKEQVQLPSFNLGPDSCR